MEERDIDAPEKPFKKEIQKALENNCYAENGGGNHEFIALCFYIRNGERLVIETKETLLRDSVALMKKITLDVLDKADENKLDNYIKILKTQLDMANTLKKYRIYNRINEN